MSSFTFRMHQNQSANALPQTPLKILQRFPHRWFQDSHFPAGRGQVEGKG